MESTSRIEVTDEVREVARQLLGEGFYGIGDRVLYKAGDADMAMPGEIIDLSGDSSYSVRLDNGDEVRASEDDLTPDAGK